MRVHQCIHCCLIHQQFRSHVRQRQLHFFLFDKDVEEVTLFLNPTSTQTQENRHSSIGDQANVVSISSIQYSQ